MDRLNDFSEILHAALDQVDGHSEVRDNSAVRTFADHCRKFKAGETIQDYPDWLDELEACLRRMVKSGELPKVSMALKKFADAIISFSYGATEDRHVEAAEVALAELRQLS